MIPDLDKAYGAGVQALDYARTEEARETINTWVEDKTAIDQGSG